MDCGNSDPRVLDICHKYEHAVRAKTPEDRFRKGESGTQIRRRIALGGSIEKYEIRCANCHRIETAENGEQLGSEYYKRRREFQDGERDSMDDQLFLLE